MKALRDLDVLCLAAELGSLSAAARRLGMTPAAASMALRRLEQELGAPLFVRSTRSLRLTDAGRVFVDRCRQALQVIEDARETIQSGRGALSGLLQLSLPSDLGRNVVLPWLDHFLTAHPGVQLRLLLSDRLADIYRQPVDLALRYGSLPDSGLVALPVAPGNYRVLCASPDYLAQHGVPQHPHDLLHHNCLRFMLGDEVHAAWRFSRDGALLSVAVTGRQVADDGDAVHRWALAGQGIAYKSALDVAGDLASSRLVRLLPDWQGEPAPLHLLCADRRQLSPVVQALRETLVAECGRRLAMLGY